jgi:hypothetical protein
MANITSIQGEIMIDKVEYVREQAAKTPKDNDHTCHWPGCNLKVPPAMWGCKIHWYRLPMNLRNKIWSTYRPGQEINKDPSRQYLEAANEVDEWIKENYHQAK